MDNATMSDADATRKELHREEIDRLRLEIYMFILCSILVWIICLTILYRHDLSLRKRRRQDDVSIVLEEEQGQCQYMISFFTGMKYISPPSGVVRLHLIGSSFPGRFHEFTSDTPTALFAPLSRERFVVTEDVPLGRIIAIVLQTEVEGENPNWVCHTVIVREIQTNEAWFFRIDQEIGFPPRTFYPSAEDELTSFKFSVRRRVRREVRQGQYIYFGFWFRPRGSVYRISQRVVTTVACHLVLLALSLFILGIALPPETLPQESDDTQPISYEAKGISLGMGNGKINWVLHAVTIGTMTSFLTSCVGYVMVALFRQRTKYEKEFEEMDYAIGTAMREHKLLKEKQRSLMKKTKKLLKAIKEGRRKSEKKRSARSISKSVTSLFARKSHANALETKSVHHPHLVNIRQADQFPNNRIEEFMILGGDDGKSDVTEVESMMGEEGGPLVLLPGTTKPGLSTTKSKARLKRDNELRVSWLRNSQRERKAIVPVLYSDTDKPSTSHAHGANGEETPAPDKSPSTSTITTIGIREFENSLVESLKHRLERAEHGEPSTSSTPRSTLIFRTDSIVPDEDSLKPPSWEWKTAAEKRAMMRAMFVDNNFQHSRSTKVSLSEIHLEVAGVISAEQQSWFGSPIKPQRKWYKPIIAWVFVILMIGLSIAGIIVTVLVGEVQLNGANEFFFLILIATIMTSFLMGAFIVETIKIWVIALISAAWDKKIHKRITKVMKERESRASMMYQNARKSTISNFGEF